MVCPGARGRRAGRRARRARGRHTVALVWLELSSSSSARPGCRAAAGGPRRRGASVGATSSCSGSRRGRRARAGGALAAAAVARRRRRSRLVGRSRAAVGVGARRAGARAVCLGGVAAVVELLVGLELLVDGELVGHTVGRELRELRELGGVGISVGWSSRGCSSTSGVGSRAWATRASGGRGRSGRGVGRWSRLLGATRGVLGGGRVVGGCGARAWSSSRVVGPRSGPSLRGCGGCRATPAALAAGSRLRVGGGMSGRGGRGWVGGELRELAGDYRRRGRSWRRSRRPGYGASARRTFTRRAVFPMWARPGRMAVNVL